MAKNNYSNQLPSEAVRKRLEILIREAPCDDYTSISALIGKNHAYIQQFIKRGQPTRLKEEDRKIIAQHFEVTEWELGAPPTPPESSLLNDYYEDKITFVPHFEIQASAGDGSHVDLDYFENFLPFQTGWLKKITTTSLKHLSTISVKGDSMHPTLSDGDQILVEMNNSLPDREGIYVLRVSDALHVKRISLNPISNLVSIKSDNPLYENWESIKPENINIVGRVVWVGRKL